MAEKWVQKDNLRTMTEKFNTNAQELSDLQKTVDDGAIGTYSFVNHSFSGKPIKIGEIASNASGAYIELRFRTGEEYNAFPNTDKSIDIHFRFSNETSIEYQGRAYTVWAEYGITGVGGIKFYISKIEDKKFALYTDIKRLSGHSFLQVVKNEYVTFTWNWKAVDAIPEDAYEVPQHVKAYKSDLEPINAAIAEKLTSETTGDTIENEGEPAVSPDARTYIDTKIQEAISETEYEVATTTTLGLVKASSDVEVADDGTMSVPELHTINNNVTTLDNRYNARIGVLDNLVTGNKTSLVAAINETFRLGSEKKAKLVENLTARGITCSTNDSWETLLGYILTIK